MVSCERHIACLFRIGELKEAIQRIIVNTEKNCEFLLHLGDYYGHNIKRNIYIVSFRKRLTRSSVIRGQPWVTEVGSLLRK